MAQDVRILIMDEPTSALSTSEVEVLFGVIRDLKANGVSIIYISHKLDELLQIGDYVTVLRDGKLMAERPASARSTYRGSSSRWWAAIRHHFSTIRNANSAKSCCVSRRWCCPVSAVASPSTMSRFSLRRGEILGIYGLMGAGRSELFEKLARSAPGGHRPGLARRR